MIHVTVVRKENLISSIEISGHANSGPYGYDLVCAAVSGVSMGMINAVIELTETDLNIEQGGEGGYLKVAFKTLSPNDNLKKAQLLLEGMLVSLASIEMEYDEFIQIHEQ